MNDKKQSINIFLLGKTGVGKSSFINYLFGSDVCEAGHGRPITRWSSIKEGIKIDFKGTLINIYDSKGIEVDDFSNWRKELKKFLQKKNKNLNIAIHGIFYLINAASGRVEEAELEVIKELWEKKYPLQVILTNCDSATEDQIKKIKARIKDKNKNIEPSEICSVALKKRSGGSKQYGKEETLQEFFTGLEYRLYLKLKLDFLRSCLKLIKFFKKRQVLLIKRRDRNFFDEIFSDSCTTEEILEAIFQEELGLLLGSLNDKNEGIARFLKSLGFNSSKGKHSDYTKYFLNKLITTAEVALKEDQRFVSALDLNKIYSVAGLDSYIGWMALGLSTYMRCSEELKQAKDTLFPESFLISRVENMTKELKAFVEREINRLEKEEI